MTGPRVFIVDDSADQRLLLRTYFERAGCSVETADSAESALALDHASAPTIAVIDLMLPGMAGSELAQAIRSRFPDCAIVITSVLDPENYPDADAVLPKPVTGKDVRRVVEQCVLERRS
jgi:CheY-like chemotaxis protein